MLEELLDRSSWGAILAADHFARGDIAGVLVALLVAVLVGVVLWVIAPTRPWAGPAAIVTFIVLLLLLLV